MNTAEPLRIYVLTFDDGPYIREERGPIEPVLGADLSLDAAKERAQRIRAKRPTWDTTMVITTCDPTVDDPGAVIYQINPADEWTKR